MGPIFLDFTFQTPLQCKIALKTGMQTVCDIKSRIDPCLSHNSHGSKLLLMFCQVYIACTAQKKRNSGNNGGMFALDGEIYKRNRNILHAR